MVITSNESEIDQNGTNNNATVTQDGGVEGSADINQGTTVPGVDAENATASITQTESSSNGTSPGFQIPSNEAVINQSGANMRADITQNAKDGVSETNVATVDQFSSGANLQRAAIDQDGEGNLATASQGETATFPVRQTSGQRVSVTQEGDFNESYTDQKGNDGFARVEQYQDGNYSDINQPGLEGTATVYQDGLDNESYISQSGNFHEAYVDQVGDGNISDISQLGGANYGFASVQQSGNMNTSTVTQRRDAGLSTPPRPSGNRAIVAQNGDYNDSLVYQSGEDGGNLARVSQEGENQTSVIYQTGDDNRAIVDEQGPGAGNTSGILQTGDENYTEVDQDGASNESYVAQIGDGNRAVIRDQDGDDNDSYILQTGSTNVALVDDQDGTNNTSVVWQGGDGNRATVNQAASNNISLLTQVGSDNRAAVSQTGMDNDSFILQASDSNVATVTQLTAGNTSSVYQYGGTGNVATVTQ